LPVPLSSNCLVATVMRRHSLRFNSHSDGFGMVAGSGEFHEHC